MGLFDSIRRVVGGGESTTEESAAADDPELLDTRDLDVATLREHAENVAGEVEQLDFSLESLEQFDAAIDAGYDDELHTPDTPGVYDRDVVRFGAYLGEVIVRVYGGEWTHEDDWGVTMAGPDDTVTVSVFAVVRRSISSESVFAPVVDRAVETVGLDADDPAEPHESDTTTESSTADDSAVEAGSPEHGDGEADTFDGDERESDTREPPGFGDTTDATPASADDDFPSVTDDSTATTEDDDSAAVTPDDGGADDSSAFGDRETDETADDSGGFDDDRETDETADDDSGTDGSDFATVTADDEIADDDATPSGPTSRDDSSAAATSDDGGTTSGFEFGSSDDPEQQEVDTAGFEEPATTDEPETTPVEGSTDVADDDQHGAAEQPSDGTGAADPADVAAERVRSDSDPATTDAVDERVATDTETVADTTPSTAVDTGDGRDDADDSTDETADAGFTNPFEAATTTSDTADDADADETDGSTDEADAIGRESDGDTDTEAGGSESDDEAETVAESDTAGSESDGDGDTDSNERVSALVNEAEPDRDVSGDTDTSTTADTIADSSLFGDAESTTEGGGSSPADPDSDEGAADRTAGAADTDVTDTTDEAGGGDPADDIEGVPSAADADPTGTPDTDSTDASDPVLDSTDGDGLRAEYAEEAAGFVSFWNEHDFDYTPESLERLDDLVSDEWDAERFEDATFGGEATFDDRAFTSVSTELGSYFGEVLVRELDAEWSDETDMDSVVVDGPDGPLAIPVFRIAGTSLKQQPVFAHSYESLLSDLGR